jgi:ribose transport system ATP-binding protein
LSTHDVEKLFAFLKKLKAEGVAIIYVSHRMDEIMKIADRATILRDGHHVITAPLTELTLDSIIEHIVGKQSRGLSGILRDDTRRDGILLELKNVSGQKKPQNLNLTVHAGEVVGIAGLLGSGRSAIARLLFGIDPKVSGEILVAGRIVDIDSPAEAIAHGIALIPEDRLRQGVVLEHSVADNIALSVFDRISKRGWISKQRWSDLAVEKIRSLKVKTASAAAAVRTLSGGNQQKVVLAKWLASDPRIIVFDEPTAGIDIGSKSEIIQLIRELAREGKAIVVISSELNELLAACDRILVMSDGRLLRNMRRQEFEDPTAGHQTAADTMQFAERKLQTILQEVRNND